MDIDKFNELTKSPLDEIKSFEEIIGTKAFREMDNTFSNLFEHVNIMSEGSKAFSEIDFKIVESVRINNYLSTLVEIFNNNLDAKTLSEAETVLNDIANADENVTIEKHYPPERQEPAINVTINNITINNVTNTESNATADAHSNLVMIVTLSSFALSLLSVDQDKIRENLELIFHLLNKLFELWRGF